LNYLIDGRKGGERVGMTNEQFDTYKTSLLRNLERAQKEISEKNVTSETLEIVVQDLKSDLKKP